MTSIFDFYSRIFTIKIHAQYDKCQGHNERSWTLFNVYKSQAAIGSNCFRKKYGPMKSCFTIPYKIIQYPFFFFAKSYGNKIMFLARSSMRSHWGVCREIRAASSCASMRVPGNERWHYRRLYARLGEYGVKIMSHTCVTRGRWVNIGLSFFTSCFYVGPT